LSDVTDIAVLVKIFGKRPLKAYRHIVRTTVLTAEIRHKKTSLYFSRRPSVEGEAVPIIHACLY
jgi:hypothetical protein